MPWTVCVPPPLYGKRGTPASASRRSLSFRATSWSLSRSSGRGASRGFSGLSAVLLMGSFFVPARSALGRRGLGGGGEGFADGVEDAVDERRRLLSAVSLGD